MIRANRQIVLLICVFAAVISNGFGKNVEDIFSRGIEGVNVIVERLGFPSRLRFVGVTQTKNNIQFTLLERVPSFLRNDDGEERSPLVTWRANRKLYGFYRPDPAPKAMQVAAEVNIPSYTYIARRKLPKIFQPNLRVKHITFDERPFYTVGEQKGTKLDGLKLSGVSKRILGCLGSTPRFPRRVSGVFCGGDSSRHSNQAESSAVGGNPCLLKGRDGACVGGIRRTSRLYDAIGLLAVLLCGLIAGISAGNALRFGKKSNGCWIALGATSAVVGWLILIASISGKLWLLGV